MLLGKFASDIMIEAWALFQAVNMHETQGIIDMIVKQRFHHHNGALLDYGLCYEGGENFRCGTNSYP